jgi:capsular exopolysaccharide synthesis family protein
MSHVDEALRRVRLGSSADFSGEAERRRAADQSILEQYRTERSFTRREIDNEPAASAVAAPRVPLRAARIGSVLDGKLVGSREISAFSVEQYRRLGAALQDLQGSRGLKTIMVSSAVPGEGKTLTVSNLALTLSESYKRRVLLVDADLRRPSIHELFGLSNGDGLCDELRSKRGALSAVEVTANLSVLVAGRSGPDPMADLSSDRMRTLIQEAASRFDWVFLDTPPVSLLADAQLLARVSDAVLLVIAARTTPYQFVERSITELGADRIIGTVLNRTEEHAFSARGYYSGYYHHMGAEG